MPLARLLMVRRDERKYAMKTISIVLLFFLGIGVLARSFNRRTTVLLVAGIAAVVLYLMLTTTR